MNPVDRPDRRELVVLGTPMTLGLARVEPERQPGVAGLASALRGAGLCEALGATDLGDLPAPRDYRHDRDSVSGVRNLSPIRAHTLALAATLTEPLDRGAFTLLLGGDCSVLLGPLLALRRRGQYGLLHLDGHTDFYPPDVSASGQIAAMELWIATGGDPAELADIEDLRPLVRPEHTVLLGHRDHEERIRSGAPDPADALRLALPFEEVRAEGADVAVREAMEILVAPQLEGFWIHLDADVLDDAVMPAVDTRAPGGISHAELALIVSTAMASGRACGMTVTIYDPLLDPSRTMARALVETLAGALL